MRHIAQIERWIASKVATMPDGRLKRFYSRLSFRTILAFMVFTVAMTVFVGLADEMKEQDTMTIDAWVLQNIHYYFGSDFLDNFMPILTDAGGVIGIAILTALAAVVFSLKKQYRRVYVVLAGVGGAVILNQLLKAIFARVRPNLWEQLVVENSFSFPSGHSMASSALALSLVVALWYTRWRWLALVGGSLYVLFVGFSRLYLGVHYPTDVVAGWAVSLAWVLLVWALFRGSKHTDRLNDRTQ